LAATARRSASGNRAKFPITATMWPPALSWSGVRPASRSKAMSAAEQPRVSGVGAGMRPRPAGFGAPAIEAARSSAPAALRWVWHSAQWASASTG